MNLPSFGHHEVPERRVERIESTVPTRKTNTKNSRFEDLISSPNDKVKEEFPNTMKIT